MSKLKGDNLISNGKITSLELFKEYLETSPSVLDLQCLFKYISDYTNVVEAIVSSNISVDSKSEYLNTLLSIDAPIDKKHIKNVLLDLGVPRFVKNITNSLLEQESVAEDNRHTLITKFLLTKPSLEEFRYFITKNGHFLEIIQILDEYCENFTNKTLSEYLYIIGEVTDDESLFFDLIEAILTLGDILVIRRMMMSLDIKYHNMYIDKALKTQDLNLLVNLACAIDGPRTPELIDAVLKCCKPKRIAKMLYNLNPCYISVTVEKLTWNPNLFVKTFDTIAKIEQNRIKNGESSINLLKFFLKTIDRIHMSSLYDTEELTRMRQLSVQDDNLKR